MKTESGQAFVVDDETNLRESLAELIAGEGFRVAKAGDGFGHRQAPSNEFPDNPELNLPAACGAGRFLLQFSATLELALKVLGAAQP